MTSVPAETRRSSCECRRHPFGILAGGYLRVIPLALPAGNHGPGGLGELNNLEERGPRQPLPEQPAGPCVQPVRGLRRRTVRTGQGAIRGHRRDTARSILAETDRLAREDLAASYAAGDRTPPVYDPATFSVKMPESFREVVETFMAAEFWGLDLPEALGGTLRRRRSAGGRSPRWCSARRADWCTVGPRFAAPSTSRARRSRRMGQLCSRSGGARRWC